MERDSLLTQRTEPIRVIFDEIDAKTTAFQEKTGLGCIDGCGQCCLSPHIETFVSELLPLAHHLLAKGDGERIYRAIEESGSVQCILYQPEPENPQRGRCAAYEHRPSICRLFGFSTVTAKETGKSQLYTCLNIKKAYPKAVKKAEELIQSGEESPHIRDFTLRIEVLAPGTADSRKYPINQALKFALDKVSLLIQCESLEDHSHPLSLLSHSAEISPVTP